MDARSFRQVMGRFPTGVAVVTARDGEGAPILDGVSAWLECSLEVAQQAGDHTILVGRVDEAGPGTGEALAFYRGAFRAVTGP